MSLTSEIAGIDEVAAALGRPEGWLRRNWLKLHEQHGFPRRHPSGWTWPRAAVAAWLRSGGFAAPEEAPANDNGSSDHLAAYQAALNDRYGGQP